MRMLKPHALLDHLIKHYGVRNDAHLAQTIGVYKSVFSKIRNCERTVSDEMIVAIHEATDMPLKEVKAMAHKCNVRITGDY